jgi:hypothetical protein
VSRVMLIVGAPLALAADVPLARMLRRARPRPFGLTVPAVMPAMVSSAEADGSGDVASVELCYGRMLNVTGPLIEVQTCFYDDDGDPSAVQEAIIRAELRDQAWARQDWAADTGVFSPVPAVQVPADGFKQSERQIVAAGHDYLVPVISRGVYEALRFTADATVITAVARMGFPERLQFDVIEDLEPIWSGANVSSSAGYASGSDKV